MAEFLKGISKLKLILILKDSRIVQLFQIAYCEFFEASKATEWQSVFKQQHMPSLLQKQKIHMILHVVECMKELGPSSAFSAER